MVLVVTMLVLLVVVMAVVAGAAVAPVVGVVVVVVLALVLVPVLVLVLVLVLGLVLWMMVVLLGSSTCPPSAFAPAEAQQIVFAPGPPDFCLTPEAATLGGWSWPPYPTGWRT